MTPNDEEEEIEKEEEFVENKFICRDCKKTVDFGEGDDMILLCDDCLELYNEEKIWKDFDKEKIKEEDLKTFELTPYLNPKGKKKRAYDIIYFHMKNMIPKDFKIFI